LNYIDDILQRVKQESCLKGNYGKRGSI